MLDMVSWKRGPIPSDAYYTKFTNSRDYTLAYGLQDESHWPHKVLSGSIVDDSSGTEGKPQCMLNAEYDVITQAMKVAVTIDCFVCLTADVSAVVRSGPGHLCQHCTSHNAVLY